MAQGKFTKEEAERSREALDEIMNVMPRKLIPDFIGHFNDIFLFLSAAKAAAPSEKKAE